MKEKKPIFIDRNNFVSEKDQALTKAVEEYEILEQQIKEFNKRKEELKEILKKYDFELLTISGTDSNLSMKIRQYDMVRNEFDKKQFISKVKESLEDTSAALVLGLLETAHKEKVSKCIRITLERVANKKEEEKVVENA